MKTRILTIGGSSMITSIRCAKYPRPGETQTAEKYAMRPGGRGMTASVAIAKLGADSVFCSSVGEDSYASALRDICRGFGVDTRFITGKAGVRTGASTLIISADGYTTKLDIPGANSVLSSDMTEDAFTCLPDALLLMSSGINRGAVISAAAEAVRREIPFVADLCGADSDFPLEKLSGADIVIIDTLTAEKLTGILPAGEQSGLKVTGTIENRLKTRYVIILLEGSKGIFLSDNKYHEMLMPFGIVPVDESAAEESFISSLTLDYIRGIQSGGRNINHACTFAALAKAWTLATKGSASSLPTDEDMKEFAESNSIEFEFYR